jgi:hypothetical protein
MNGDPEPRPTRLAGAVDHLVAASCLVGIAPASWRASPDATFADLRSALRSTWPAARLPELAR